MKTSRIYQATTLTEKGSITLDERAFHYLTRVLRATTQDRITLFNGQGGEYEAIITNINKKSANVYLEKFIDRECESALNICLVQGISRGEKMDFTIQKAVELGVKQIIPLFTERCNVKLDLTKRGKRLEHWQSVAISACEQCGRNQIPVVFPIEDFTDWLKKISPEDIGLVLSPTAKLSLSAVDILSGKKITLLIGPEGGLSHHEIEKVIASGFQAINLGPRILRTETAALAAIAGLEALST